MSTLLNPDKSCDTFLTWRLLGFWRSQIGRNWSKYILFALFCLFPRICLHLRLGLFRSVLGTAGFCAGARIFCNVNSWSAAVGSPSGSALNAFLVFTHSPSRLTVYSGYFQKVSPFLPPVVHRCTCAHGADIFFYLQRSSNCCTPAQRFALLFCPYHSLLTPPP